jgi:alpha-glucosidase
MVVHKTNSTYTSLPMTFKCTPAILFLALAFPRPTTAQSEVHLRSPDGRLVFNFNCNNRLPQYSVDFNLQPVMLPSSLDISIKDRGDMEQVYMTAPPVLTEKQEHYTLVVGKAKEINDSYREAVISLGDKNNKEVRFQLAVRAFNDGIAFRFLFPRNGGAASFTLLDEKTEFHFAGDPLVKALLLPNFTSSHEGLYTTLPLSKMPADSLMDLPTLVQLPGNIFVGVTEAALLDYAGMYLLKYDGVLVSQLSPLPGQTLEKVKSTLPHNSPWRVLLISDRVGALIESNIITSLNAPLALKDVSWIRPGTSTFPWWNGTIVPDSIHGGNNFETNKYYIDFCAAHHIRYHTIVEYGGHEWYTNDGSDYQPGPHADITKPVEGLDMKRICDYARERNVGIRVWTHWKALYPKLDTAFALFEKWGIGGMMVDFMDRDDQQMVNIQTEILQKAALHHLHIQFHGAFKNTGLHRMYPNEFTREGTLNYEHDKWDNMVSPDADINIPFTRMLAGSTDYHLGGFHALPYAKFVVQNFRPFVMGTRCHMLAMYVVLENYLSMVCDYPDAYIGQPGFEVIEQIPTSWDETRVPAAEVDQYVSIARRKNTTWYMGTISNNESRAVSIKLGFLPAGNYQATIYGDAPDADQDANHLTKTVMTVTNHSILALQLAAGGGNFVILKKLTPKK